VSCVRRAQRVAEEEGELGKHLTRQGFLAWAKRFPAVATTMRSLLAVGAAQDSSGSPAAGASSIGAGDGATSGLAPGDQSAADGSQAGTGGRVQLPPVPQLISLEGISARSCLLRPEWAWAIAASGQLSTQVLSLEML
jgi:hypothetical protein